MKKEKQVKSYQRRTKSGKVVTVKAHTAKYDAAEKAKEAAKKKGAGKELEDKFGKKKMPDPNLSMNEYLDELKKGKKSGSNEVANEDEKTQRSGLSSLEKKLTSKESKLKELKNSHSTMKRSDPKKLALAKKIQKLQSDIIETKSAVASQRKVVTDLNTSKSKKRSEGEGASMVEHNGKQYFVNFKTGKVETSSGKPISSNGAIAKAILSKHKENRVTPKDKKPMVQTTKSSAKPTSSGQAFTAAEFKEWYRGTGSAADKKVAKALRSQLGRSGYRKFEDEAINNYSSRGHLSMFKRIGTNIEK